MAHLLSSHLGPLPLPLLLVILGQSKGSHLVFQWIMERPQNYSQARRLADQMEFLSFIYNLVFFLGQLQLVSEKCAYLFQSKLPSFCLKFKSVKKQLNSLSGLVSVVLLEGLPLSDMVSSSFFRSGWWLGIGGPHSVFEALGRNGSQIRLCGRVPGTAPLFVILWLSLVVACQGPSLPGRPPCKLLQPWGLTNSPALPSLKPHTAGHSDVSVVFFGKVPRQTLN